MSKKFVTIVYFAFITFLFVIIDSRSHSVSDTLLNFALPLAGATALLVSFYRSGVRDEEPLPGAGKILKTIKKSKSILLHCHPSPDPDSLGSVLAMKYSLQDMHKKVTVIQGDSNITPAFMHFPGATEILQKSFSEVDLKEFDLFIILDSGSPEMISRKAPPTFPLPIKTIVIDHHASNKGYGEINLVASAPSTTYILYRLFKEWGIHITPEIASNLFIGLYTDTGGFKFPPTNGTVYKAAGELVDIAPNFIEVISKMENSQDKDFIYGQALALSSIREFPELHLAISAVSHAMLSERHISTNAISEGHISNIIKSVIGWDIAATMVEIEPGRIKCSFRSIKYDVSKLAVALGGGGHKAAAGAILTTSLEEAVSKVAETVKTLYNL